MAQPCVMRGRSPTTVRALGDQERMAPRLTNGLEAPRQIGLPPCLERSFYVRTRDTRHPAIGIFVSTPSAPLMTSSGSLEHTRDFDPILLTACRTLYSCQQLEYGLKLVVYLLNATGMASISDDQASALMEGRASKTMGQVVATIRKHVILSDGWSDLIDAGLAARNTVTHGYLITNVDRMIDLTTRPVVLAELKALRKQILAADGAVRQILETLYPIIGVRFDDLMLAAEIEFKVRSQVSTNGSNDAVGGP